MTQYVASIRRDGRGYRGRIRVFLVPFDDDLARHLEGRIGQEVEVEVEGSRIKCRITHDGDSVALRPIEKDRLKILKILRRGRRFVRVSLA